MYRNYIRENATLVSVILFIIIFGLIQMMKPACFYNKDGSIREFGIGYKNNSSDLVVIDSFRYFMLFSGYVLCRISQVILVIKFIIIIIIHIFSF